MENLGMGVMLGILGGNEETVNAIQTSLNKVIKSVRLDKDDNSLKFEFDDSTILKIWDDGQSCCEDRYMRTDDNLVEFEGAKFLNVELKDAPTALDEEYGEHEIQFLDITTDKGVFQMANHNEHNGYYGGFYIKASNSF